MSNQTQDMTWADYMATLRRRWRPVLAAVALVALGSVYLAYTLPAVYESSATILIEQQGVPTDYVQTSIDAYAEELLQKLRQRVLVVPNVAALIQEHGLYPEEIGVWNQDDLVTLFRDSVVMVPQNVTTINARTGRESIITFGFLLTFRYHEAQKARDVAQALATLYVSQNEAMRAEAAARTSAFLDAEAERLQDQLAAVGERIAAFKAQYPDNLPENQGLNLTLWERARTDLMSNEAQLRDARERKSLLETELAETPRYRPVLDETGEAVLGGVDRLGQAQQELIRLRGRYSENHPAIVALRNEISALSSSSVNQETLVQQLRADLAVRQQELAAAQQMYSDSHPDVIRLQRNIELLEQQLSSAVAGLAASGSGSPTLPNNPVYLSLQTRIRTVNAEIADVTRIRNQLNARLADLDQKRLLAPQVEREFAGLIQEQELLLSSYRDLRGLKGEAALAESLETGDAGERLTIVDPPRVPSDPVSPDRVSLSFLGIVLSIALGLGVASLAEAMDTTVRGQRDVYQLLDMPPIGIIPYVETRADTVKRLAINSVMAAVLVAATTYVAIVAMA